MKVNTKVLLVLLMVMAYASKANAYNFKVGSFYYNILSSSAKTVAVTYYSTTSNSYSGNLVVPTSVTVSGVKYTVTTIGIRAFYNCPNLLSVTIPSSVTKIEDEAFSFCSTLHSVNMPSTLKSIGGNAFYMCKQLTDAIIPNSVTSIGDYAFRYCESLSAINISKNVSNIGYSAFCDCTGVKSITVEAGNPYYDSRDNCNALIESKTNRIFIACCNSTIPEGVETIGSTAFYNMRTLETIELPNTVKKIESMAFAGCSNLKTAIIPNSVTYIGSDAFEHCTKLTTVSLPNSITEIADEMFWDCPSLKTIIIPSSVKKIGQSAFWGCSGLKTIVIPESVENIANYAFGNCKALENMEIEAGSKIIPYTYSIFYGLATSKITLKINGDNAPRYVADSYWGNFDKLIINGYLPGDVNGDNVVNDADLTAIASYIIGETPNNFNSDAADYNWNGNITIGDLTSITKRMLQSINR